MFQYDNSSGSNSSSFSLHSDGIVVGLNLLWTMRLPHFVGLRIFCADFCSSRRFPYVPWLFNCFSMWFFFSLLKMNRNSARVNGYAVLRFAMFELHGKLLTAARWFIGIGFGSHLAKWNKIFHNFLFLFFSPSKWFLFLSLLLKLHEIVFFCWFWLRVTTTEAEMLITMSIFNAVYAKFIYLWLFVLFNFCHKLLFILSGRLVVSVRDFAKWQCGEAITICL